MLAENGENINFSYESIETEKGEPAYLLRIENKKTDKGLFVDKIILETTSKYQPEINTQIEVHPLFSSNVAKNNLILFLPSIQLNHITLFLIRAEITVVTIIINCDKPEWKVYQQIIGDVFYDSSYKRKSEFTEEQITIIWRWINLNKDRINYIDVDKVGSLENCLQAIKKYSNDEELFRRKIDYRLT